MRHAFDLTPAILADLRTVRPTPAISISLPTHRRVPDDQDGIRLRNLVSEARKRLADDPSIDRATRLDVGARLDDAVQDVDLGRTTEGTVLFVAPGEHHVWALPTTVPERVVFSDTFLTRYLVSSWLHEAPYWVLVVNEESSRLWHGAGLSLEEVTTGGFPLRPAIPDPEDSELGANFGSRPDSYREERMRQYLRSVDEHLAPVLHGAPAPVHMLAVESVLNAFAALTRNPGALSARVARGDGSRLTEPELVEVIRPARTEYAAERTRDALAALDRARSEHRFAAGAAEVGQALTEARVALLLVEDGYRITATVDSGGTFTPVPPDTPGAVDDVVDTMVESALDTDAEVRFVPDGELADHGRIAATLRY